MKALLRFSFLLIILVSFQFCSESPRDYLEKAEKALKDENSALALKHYQSAYEISLKDSFYPVDKSDGFVQMARSADRQSFLLTSVIEEGGSRFTVYSVKNDDVTTVTVKDDVEKTVLSPTGVFIAYMLPEKGKPETGNDAGAEAEKSEENAEQKEVCTISGYNLKKDRQSEHRLPVSCDHGIAVNDKGEVFYLNDKYIARFSIVTGENIEEVLPRFPDRPVSKFPAFASFKYSADNVLYMTYGAAGNYKLYNIENSLKLLLKGVASSDIYFRPGDNNPGVVTGGAGNHKLVFVNGRTGSITENYGKNIWTDAAFTGSKIYYLLEIATLKKMGTGAEEDIKLPFWALDIETDDTGRLYLLTPSGRFIRYSDKEPSEKSLKIFEKGVELDSRRE